MNDETFERLAKALGELPNGFPRTPSNVEIPMLKKIFSPEEAELAGRLRGEMESVEDIAARINRPAAETKEGLIKLAKRGIVWVKRDGGTLKCRLAPFIVGIYESFLEGMDHEFAHLVEHYFADGGAAGIMRPQPAIHRVIPGQKAVKTEWILPYDDVRAILLGAKRFGVRDCICRVQQDKLSRRRCTFPIKNCLYFSVVESPPRPGDISREEALTILDQAEETGLVHCASNIARGINYICNCCGCCCGILRGITEWGIANSVAHANYYAVIDQESCSNCGICRDRCQVHAVVERDNLTVVERDRCIGCGLCVSGCPVGAVRLRRKPADEIIHPPEDFSVWEKERRRQLGLP